MSENKQAQAEEIKLTLDPEAEEQEALKEEGYGKVLEAYKNN